MKNCLIKNNLLLHFCIKVFDMKKSVFMPVILIMLIATFQMLSCIENNPPNTNVDTRKKFLGTWSVAESCVRLNYDVDISADENNSSRVFLNNFADAPPEFQQAYGTVNGYQINIPEQTIGDGWIINGIGTLQQSGKIVWAYYIEIGAVGSTCHAEYEK